VACYLYVYFFVTSTSFPVSLISMHAHFYAQYKISSIFCVKCLSLSLSLSLSLFLFFFPQFMSPQFLQYCSMCVWYRDCHYCYLLSAFIICLGSVSSLLCVWKFGKGTQSSTSTSIKMYLMAILDSYVFRPLLAIFSFVFKRT